MTETKLKRNGEFLWCRMNGIIVGVQEIESTREGMAIFIKNECHSAVIGFGCITSRILYGLSSSFQVLKYAWWEARRIKSEKLRENQYR